MGILKDAAFRRQFFRNALRGVLGLAIATPVIAVVQGKYLLSDFRKNHKDAPFPDMPCSGVVVVHPLPHQGNKGQPRTITIPQKRLALGSTTKASTKTHSSWFSSFPLLREQKEPDPLRLLVVGDSLAAGVGVTKSGTPVLPEAIAKSLSSALGGRAVYWTCMGEPGLSSPQIVKELLLAEEDTTEEKEKPIDVMDELKDWWHERRQQHHQRERDEDLELEEKGRKIPEPAKKIRSWWRKTRRGVKKDFQELRDKISWKELGESVKGRLDLSKKIPEPSVILPLRRRNTVVPDLVAQYDVAVVITGFNDLKNLIFPLPEDPNQKPTKQSTDSGEEDGLSSNAWFEKDLFSIMHALRGKMRNYGIKIKGESDDHKTLAKNQVDCTSDSESAEQAGEDTKGDLSETTPRRHHPMVVFPATPLFAEKVYPLSLFANPIVALMEYQKKKLSEKYSPLVLFLEGHVQVCIFLEKLLP